ncbi:MAG: hypothetical protein HKN59_05075 [Gammaproteobacteria bacterium]|nr:hypothetical protein [Gammaproteobacteria bacterium]
MRRILLLSALVLLGATAVGHAAPFVKIKILQPATAIDDGSSSDNGSSDDSSDDQGANGVVRTLNSFSGWPLTIRMTMRNELGIASSQGNPGEPPFYSGKGKPAFVIFRDPDDCLAMDIGGWNFPVGDGCPPEGDPPPPSDETYFAFIPDVDDIGLPTGAQGFSDRIDFLVDATSGRQKILGVDFDVMTPVEYEVGARTSFFAATPEEEIKDGYGYGADDDIPGLVILARHGPGIAYQPNGVARSPLELINLAGFINSVSYELSTPKNQVVVTAQMVVPPFLIAPVVVADDSYDDGSGTPAVWWRIDGSPTEVPASTATEDVVSAFKGYPNLVDDQPYTISVMAVSGEAPDRVIDQNGDQQITPYDLRAMGYQVISRMKSVSVELFPGIACHGGSGENTAYADLDGDGVARLGDTCPAGSGSVSKPPR